MAKPSSQRRKPQPTMRPPQPVADRSQVIAVSPAQFLAGAILLLAAVGATLALVLSHVKGISLPGCRPGGPCAEAAASAWGKVPGTSWPISFIGFAYFSGLLIAWFLSRRGLAGSLKQLIRLGVLLSVMYVVVLAVQRHLCYYCLATHAANLLFWLIVERCPTAPALMWRPIATTAAVFILASAALGAVQRSEHKEAVAQQESQLAESTQRIIEQMATPTQAQGSGTTAVTTDPAPSETQRPWKGGFTGRYRRGPENAPIRIVILTDYQCPDCTRTELDLENVLRARSDVSLSVKHFPFCKDCNPTLNTSLHPNACWAARAAETAGILHGNEGFWQMHDWLFENKGSFTNESFPEALKQMGYDVNEFNSIMTSNVTLDLVKKDVEEGIWLGLHYTPMIFINGVELTGVFAHDAITRAVYSVAATNPQPASPDNDQPPPAREKDVNDWRNGEQRIPGQDDQSWPMGSEGAPLHVVIWGDYQEPWSAKADAFVRDYIASRSDAQYVFRHYPINQTCNPVTQLTKHPMACRASQAAEAAGMLYGIDGFWKMHKWLMDNQDDFEKRGDEALQEACVQLGFLWEVLAPQMDSPEVADAIRSDCDAGKRLGLQGVPMVYVNGRFVPRWYRNGETLLGPIMDEASKQGAERRPSPAASSTP